MKLPNWKRSELRDELLTCFNDHEVNMLLTYALDGVREQIPSNAPLTTRVFELVEHAERHDLTARLLDAVIAKRPHNVPLGRLCAAHHILAELERHLGAGAKDGSGAALACYQRLRPGAQLTGHITNGGYDVLDLGWEIMGRTSKSPSPC